jgi:hypothetical protein
VPRRISGFAGTRSTRALVITLLTAALPACRPAGVAPPSPQPSSALRPRLPTGASLDPAGPSTDVGSMPLAMVLSPDGRQAVVLLNGWREQGFDVVDRLTGRVTQRMEQPAAFSASPFRLTGVSCTCRVETRTPCTATDGKTDTQREPTAFSLLQANGGDRVGTIPADSRFRPMAGCCTWRRISPTRSRW